MRMVMLRTYMLVFGGVSFLMSTLQILRFFSQPADSWWTPKALALALVDTSDRVQAYFRDGALHELVRAGRVQLLTDSGPTLVAESDVRLRVNNWDRVRAERIPSLLGAAFGLGAAAVLLLFGVLDWGPLKPPLRSE